MNKWEDILNLIIDLMKENKDLRNKYEAEKNESMMWFKRWQELDKKENENG